MQRAVYGIGRCGSGILVVTATMVVCAAAIEVKVAVPQIHVKITPPPVHPPTAQVHTLTPTVNGNVLNAAKGSQQNSSNTAKGRGKTDGVLTNKVVTNKDGAASNFTTTNNPDGNTSVQFGDGTQGQTLPTGTNNIKATYRAGDGSAIAGAAVKPVDGAAGVGPVGDTNSPVVAGSVWNGPSSGAGAGKVKFNPFGIGRKIDNASPVLANSDGSSAGDSAGNASLKPFVFTNNASTGASAGASLGFDKPGSEGKLSVYRTIELTNAAIVPYQSYHGVAAGGAAVNIPTIGDVTDKNVAGSNTTTIGGAPTQTVVGLPRSETVAGATLNVVGLPRHEIVGDATTNVVGAPRTETVGGATVNIIGAPRTETVGGATLTIGGHLVLQTKTDATTQLILSMVSSGDNDLQAKMTQMQLVTQAKQTLRNEISAENANEAAGAGVGEIGGPSNGSATTSWPVAGAIWVPRPVQTGGSSAVVTVTGNLNAAGKNLAAAANTLQNKLDSMNDLSDQDSARLQMYMSQDSKLMETASSIAKSESSTDSAVVKNMKQ